MVLEEKEYKQLLNSNYENTDLDIFFVTKGDLNITDKTLFELRMLNKNVFDHKHIYTLKYKKLNDIMIENAGHKTNELDLFSKSESFEDLKRYFKDNQYEIEEKMKKEKYEEEIEKKPNQKEEIEKKWAEEKKKEIEDENKPINYDKIDILKTIPYNINFILNYFFSKNRTIEIKGKEYIISKYKILYEKGYMHKKKNQFIKISYDEKKNEPKYTPKLINESDIIKENTEQKINDDEYNQYGYNQYGYNKYGYNQYGQKQQKKKHIKNEFNTINIVIELTILDKSKNPSYYDFAKMDCNDKKKNLENDFNLLAFSLFGVDLQKKQKDIYKRFFFNKNVKDLEKIKQKPLGYQPVGYNPFGYPFTQPPPIPPKKGGKKTIKKQYSKKDKNYIKRKKIIRKRKTIKNRNDITIE